MPHTDAVESGAAKAAVEAAYEEVRLSFLFRLRGEQAHLATLTEALGSAEVDAATAFADLERFAHRLRGAAAVFEIPELRDMAKTLEQAVSAAVALRATNSDPLVQNAIHELNARLSFLNGGPPGSVAPAPAN